MIHIVVAVGLNNEIGENNKMLWHNTEDLKLFRELTLNHKVIMGKNTFLSIGKLLDLRENIVITRTLEEKNGIILVKDINEIIEKYYYSEEIVYVIGGGSIYKELINFAEKLYISKIDEEFPDADTYFPKFNEEKYSLEVKEYNTFKLYIYTRRNNE